MTTTTTAPATAPTMVDVANVQNHLHHAPTASALATAATGHPTVMVPGASDRYVAVMPGPDYVAGTLAYVLGQIAREARAGMLSRRTPVTIAAPHGRMR